jgi:hypothetical protein
MASLAGASGRATNHAGAAGPSKTLWHPSRLNIHPRPSGASLITPPPSIPLAGKAAWIAGTAFLVLIVPLIIEMDREQQLVEFENQQLGALTGGAASGTTAPAQAN